MSAHLHAHDGNADMQILNTCRVYNVHDFNLECEHDDICSRALTAQGRNTNLINQVPVSVLDEILVHITF